MRFLLFFLLLSPLFAKPLQYTQEFAFGSEVHILEVDLSDSFFTLIKCDERETVSAVAKKQEADAAINGGFFKESGLASGIFLLDGIRYTETDRKRGAIGWQSDFSTLLIDRLDTLEDGSLISLFHPENSEAWNGMDTILGSTPVLVMDGKIIEHFEEESVRPTFVTNYHARSAVAWIDPTHLLFVVVVKDLEGQSRGMTIPEIATYLHQKGAQFAINLDGGGSSTLYYKGKVICSLGEFDEDANLGLVYGERNVGNVIVFKDRVDGFYNPT